MQHQCSLDESQDFVCNPYMIIAYHCIWHNHIVIIIYDYKLDMLVNVVESDTLVYKWKHTS